MTAKTESEYTPFPTSRVVELEQAESSTAWLVQSLWSDQAVGFIAGAPKSCKSWLGLDLAVSVASGTPCLGQFQVEKPGPALIYLAEDSLAQVRRRIAGLCRHRQLKLQDLELHVVTAHSLRLDASEDQNRLGATLAQLQPRLLVLDPLVRMHQIDENSAGEISALLSLLRRLQREHAVAIAVVHHMNKRGSAQLGQALRGSTDLHAWSDSSAYLTRHRSQLRLTIEHRSAPVPDPFEIELVTDDFGGAHLEASDGEQEIGAAVPAPGIDDLVRQALADTRKPMPRAELRRLLRVNNQRLGQALERLERDQSAARTKTGWILCRDDAASHDCALAASPALL